MKSVTKKIMATLLLASMLVSVAACGDGGNSSAQGTSSEVSSSAEATTTSDGATGTESEIPKPDKVVFMGTTVIPDEQNGQQAYADEIEKQTGIKVEFVKPAHNQYDEKVDLAFASGEVPDIIEPPVKYVTYAVNGAFWDATEAYESSEIFTKADPSYADSLRVKNRIYSVPFASGNGTITYVRQDWLDKLGIEKPTNYDEFYAMLKAFKENDPDGNGAADTIPMTVPGITDFRYYADFLKGDFTKPEFTMKNGEYIEGMYDPEMKEALERLVQAYAEGLLDQEMITNKTSTCRDKVYSGNVGVFTYWAGTWNKTINDNLIKSVPEGKMVPIAPLENSYLENRPATGLVLTSAGKNPEGIFKHLFEYFAAGGDGSMLFIRGVEGVHWQDNGGTVEAMPDGLDPTTTFIKSSYGSDLFIYPFEDPIAIDPALTESLEMFNASALQGYHVPVTEDITGNVAELKTAREEILSKMLLGTISVEAGIEEYRTKYDKLVQECLTELNKKA